TGTTVWAWQPAQGSSIARAPPQAEQKLDVESSGEPQLWQWLVPASPCRVSAAWTRVRASSQRSRAWSRVRRRIPAASNSCRPASTCSRKDSASPSRECAGEQLVGEIEAAGERLAGLGLFAALTLESLGQLRAGAIVAGREIVEVRHQLAELAAGVFASAGV